MSALGHRPRFKHLLPWPVAEVKERVQAAIDRPGAPVSGSLVKHHIFLKILPEQRRFWTPQLDVELEETKDGQTLVRGLIGPSPSVWTKFIFLYACAGFMVLFGVITGVPQWILGKPMLGLAVSGLGLIFGAGVYLVAQSGKRIGRMQTEVLRGFWLNLVEDAMLPVEAPQAN